MPRPLTADERELAARGLDEAANPKEIVASRFKVELTREQLLCLRPGQWLNDEVINFYYQPLQERTRITKGAPTCWFANSFFWPKLSGGVSCSKYSYSEVRRWTIRAKVDIFALDYVLFPINVGSMHWTVGIIDFRERGFRFLDSMGATPNSTFVPFLRRYLADEHKAKKGGPLADVDNWELLFSKTPVPQQHNGYDCGVFACYFTECFSAGRSFDFAQDDMPDFRLRLAARLMKATEHWEDP
eukprot:NODE_12076_length_1247_cov_6.458929.p1 GENE.NODE_12076_length_1247_cov_6.458929~~NODE_12076_length_1247_cov_6.458929.p1  ORF type:complete len:243 (-),score=82.07 NODE_12076_length_1247_cov_6.458929:365-1093(-)